ncbi:MAG: four helix bundle protein [Prolixibacteraceae bacterium]|nr:four helix bundle protein [Prolixibacteraceae bacterium]MBN2775555.1 four helix bundle protein [Prolixibacteraceae bacterium]
MEIGDEIWFSVINWDNLTKFTMCQQIVKSADSIAANISEGYGRYHFKDRKLFMLYARGSLSETKTWIKKAKNRKIISEEFHLGEIQKIEKLGVKLNNYISTLKAKSL